MDKTVYVNSVYRTVGSASSSDFTLEEYNGRYMNYPPKTVKLTSANIPYVWDNITADNNSVNLTEPPGPAIPITIPPGWYDGGSLAVALQNQLNASGGAGVYAVAYDGTSRHFTISSTVNFQLDFSVANSIAYRLGFASTAVTAPALSVVSTAAACVADTEIFVCSSLVGGSDNGFCKFGSGSSNDEILAVVPVNVTVYGTNITYANTGAGNAFVTSQSGYADQVRRQEDYTNMSFALKNVSGTVLDMNGADWSCIIIFSY